MYRIDICTAYSGFIYRAFRKTGSKGIYRQLQKAYIDRFERHISTAGRCVAAGHAVGSEAATGAAKPPAGSAQPTPPASQS
ncbi:hypothetical protein NQ317_018036 [Molorchus minor]|uniref:Uncharacterized protein n=1 Tax=Molorchus minor TaxID=1323400 RepID=A0ABQ9JS13_9CUCU|nr:hypothetical protein NQ317_018036 [Molorchus minor]